MMQTTPPAVLSAHSLGAQDSRALYTPEGCSSEGEAELWQPTSCPWEQGMTAYSFSNRQTVGMEKQNKTGLPPSRTPQGRMQVNSEDTAQPATMEEGHSVQPGLS